MSILIASIVGMAVSTASSAIANKEAKKQREEADEIAKYQDLIDIEQQSQSDYISKYNQTRQLAEVESSQIADSASMGKRSSASLNNMQSIAREDMSKNFERMDENLQLSKDSAGLNAGARESATKAQNKADKVGLVSSTIRNGLLVAGTSK